MTTLSEPVEVQPTCYCDHGQEATGSQCTVEGGHKCTSCNVGYHKNSVNVCVQSNTCVCQNGYPVTGSACHTQGLHKCASCVSNAVMTVASKCALNEIQGHDLVVESKCVQTMATYYN